MQSQWIIKVWWRICIHGCVDGYSRCIIYLQLNNNNRVSTVLECFQRATQTWGHPSRVRADNGGENIAVSDYMTWFRRENRGGFLTGPSVRNMRIETTMAQCGRVCGFFFSALFLFMEAESILDPNNDLDMFALHYVFLPIQWQLDIFTEQFNCHPDSTEHKEPQGNFGHQVALQIMLRPTLQSVMYLTMTLHLNRWKHVVMILMPPPPAWWRGAWWTTWDNFPNIYEFATAFHRCLACTFRTFARKQ